MYKQAVILLLMLFTASVSAALPARYMQTIENAAVWAQIGDKMVTVGNIRAGQIIAVEPTAASYYAFNFGFGKGFIDKGHLEPVQGRQKVEDGLGDLNKPLSNQNLITWKDTPVYNAPSAGSAPFGVLADNLRYPILHKLKDRLNQTWYQVRIGDRLAYISALDAQPDNGLPVLTYHHILRDEENTRFRHTSTTTSVRAFNNQMAWLRDRGYATLSMAQLEGYVKNKINLPARAVVITFDDGLKSVSRYAYPVLKQYGMKATAFIVTSRIKRHPQKWDPKSLQFMSVSELNEIRDVFDFQSHTHFLHRVDGYRRPILLSRSEHYPILHKLKDRLNQTWYQVRIGDRLAYISALDAQPDNGLPVLTYHHILRDEENTRFRHTSTTTSVRAFNNQMAWLRDRGYATLSMAQLEGYVKNKINLPARAVVITFDDGLKSVSRYAYPVLKQYGMKATAFIVTSRIKRHPQKWDPKSLQFMSVSELNEIRDVFDFQSHTHFLHRIDGYRRPILLSRSEHNILFDFARSRRALAQFNPHVWYLSYPFGGFNDKAVKAAKEAGFHLAVTTMKGKVKPGDNPLLLKRLYILRTDSLETMSRLVSNQPQG